MDSILIFLVLAVVVFRIILFILNLQNSKKIREKNKPSKATDCIFCKCTLNDNNVVKNIRCKHPSGKELSILDNPLECVVDCNVGIEDLGDMKIDYSILCNKFDKILLNELIILLSALIPSIIAIYKLMGEK